MDSETDTRQLSKTTTNALVAHIEDADSRGRGGVARKARARAKVAVRRAERRVYAARAAIARGEIGDE